jgi:hypothetical protein
MAIELPTGWSNFLATCNPPPVCTDATARGQQVIAIETAFALVPTANRASWGYISNGELYALGGNAFCYGGNMVYGSGSPPLPLDCLSGRSVAILHYINDNSTLFEALSVPVLPGASNFINVLVGHSDRPVWAAGDLGYAPNGGIRFYYDIGTVQATYELMAGSGSTQGFAVKGDECWLFYKANINPPITQLGKYNRLSGANLAFYAPWGNDDNNLYNMQLTDNYLYCLVSGVGTSRVCKINKTNGALISSLDVTALGPNNIAVADDNLIYLLCSGFPGKVYYIVNFSEMIYVGNASTLGFSPFSGTAFWNNGTIYYGATGFAGFSVDVFKIVIECPPEGGDPIIASVTTDATVARGANINVSWADVLLPISTDTIVIKPAPAAGVYGLAGSTIATGTNAGALSDGSVSITIPGGTTPGNYVAMYAALGSIWVATSAVFTVT